MVIFSHRGIGFGRKENSLEAISSAIQDGFSVEVDLRLKGDTVILSHEPIQGSVDTGEFNSLLELIKEKQDIFFALHLKDNSQQLFIMVANAIKKFKNCFLFVTDFAQCRFINLIFDIVGKHRLALYITNKNPNLNLVNRVDYLWLDETKGSVYKYLGYFMKFRKKIICCSPELFIRVYRPYLARIRSKISSKGIFGICTDFPNYYRELNNQ